VFMSIFVILSMIPYCSHAQNKKNQKSLVIRVEDFKEFKKLLRTRTNLLVICAETAKHTSKLMKMFEDVAEEMKGKATLAYINCGDDKKFCKKIKVSPKEYVLRHYKDGELNKDYDRKMSVKSMVSFLQDPTGDAPWEEDPSANDVIHVNSENEWSKLLKKTKIPMLVMFYAPWCGFCKRLKPDYAAAATTLKNDYALVGIDVDKPPMMSLRMEYNITGFPTIFLFENGRVKMKYGGENNKDGIISWMKDPQPPKEPVKEKEWSEESSEVHHLTDENFKEFVIDNPSTLVMFYAPWCGHCKKMKPGYTEAAAELKEAGIMGKLAAIDATKEKKSAEEAGVKGFPTLRYYSEGEYKFDVNEREKDKIISFMKDPKEPPPPPPPEPQWADVVSEVNHLTDETFKNFVKKKKHTLVMFYAPWCGHCKKAKPEFTNAAEKFAEDSKVAFAAMDCTEHRDTCSSHDVSGYPTFKYFNYGKNSQKYMGGREEADFVTFMSDPLNPSASAPSANKPKGKSYDEQWKEMEGWESLTFINSDNFDFVIADNPTLILHYAPWCGHCKKMKPDFALAAREVEKLKLGTLAVMDMTMQPEFAGRFDIKGYPTLKLYRNGEVIDFNAGRSKDDLVKYMKDKSKDGANKKEEL